MILKLKLKKVIVVMLLGYALIDDFFLHLKVAFINKFSMAIARS